MKKYILPIQMAIQSLVTAWPQEITAVNSVDSESLKEGSENLAAAVEGMDDETLKQEAANYVGDAVKKLYPGLIAEGEGAEEKNQELYAQINQETVNEIAEDLFNALHVEKNKVEEPAPAPQKVFTPAAAPVENPVDKIKKHDGPIWNSTPTEMQEKFGVKFKPEGESHVDYIKKRFVNIMDMLFDLGKVTASQEQRDNIIAALEDTKEAMEATITAFETK